MSLIGWSRFSFGNTKAKLEEKQKELEELTNQNLGDRMESINMVKGEINRLLYQEELTWMQWSRAIWLTSGRQEYKILPPESKPKESKKKKIKLWWSLTM